MSAVLCKKGECEVSRHYNVIDRPAMADPDPLRTFDATIGCERLRDRTHALYERTATERGITPIEAMSQLLGGWRL